VQRPPFSITTEITNNANSVNESHPILRHDILEVNAYLMSGLVVSSIDKWFIGPVPKFTPRDLGIPVEDTRPFKLVLEQIHNVAGDPRQFDWQAVSS
jgi:anaphase-promoting complex subunit 4